MSESFQPSKRARNLKSSAVFDLLQKAKELNRKGRDVISLSVGEPVWDTYDRVKEAGKKAIDAGFTKYTPSAGILELREKVSERASSDFGFSVKPANTVIASGCKQALFALFQCFFEEGDEVILPAPYWVSYEELIELSGADCKTLFCDEKEGFKITPLRLSEAITEKTKGLLINSPHNPTSAVYTEEELKALGEVLRKHPQIIVITDDIYDRLVFKGDRSPHLLTLCPDLKDQVFCVNGASKSYLMTGWRLGWVTGPEQHIKVLTAFQSQSISCSNSIVQKALADELFNCDEDIKALIQKLKPLRDQLFEKLESFSGLKPYPSEGGFYLWTSVKDVIGRSHKEDKILSSAHLMELLLERVGLICVSGESFGAPGYLRFTYGVKKQTLDKACLRLSDFFKDVN